MKRSHATRLVAILLLSIFLFNCSSDDPITIENPDPIVGGEVPINPDARNLDVSLRRIELSFDRKENLFYISNPTSKTVQWELDGEANWFTLSSTSGTLASGERIEITAQITQSFPELRENKFVSIKLTGNNDIEESSIAILFMYNRVQNADITLTVDTLYFNKNEKSKSFGIFNDTGIPFQWSVSENNDFMDVPVKEGTVANDEIAEVTVTIDRSDLITKRYITHITVQSSTNKTVQLPVVVNHFEETKWVLGERNIVDAEFDRMTNTIIAVTSSPNELLVLDPETNQLQAVALDLKPKCVSITQDGKYAAVGHDAYFSYVDLTTNQVNKVYTVPHKVFDLVITSDWVYTFGEDSRDDEVVSTKLSDGSTHGLIKEGNFFSYDNNRAKLHPSGDYIYAVNRGISPNDIYKFDIRDGVAKYLYETDYHGDYQFQEDLWINEDGTRIIAQSGNSFSVSEMEMNDMRYSGELENRPSGYRAKVSTVDTHKGANHVLAIWYEEDVPSDVLTVFNYSFLSEQQTIELPGFIVEKNGREQVIKSEGHFGFLDATGNKAYVLLKSYKKRDFFDEDTQEGRQWAIAKFDL